MTKGKEIILDQLRHFTSFIHSDSAFIFLPTRPMMLEPLKCFSGCWSKAQYKNPAVFVTGWREKKRHEIYHYSSRNVFINKNQLISRQTNMKKDKKISTKEKKKEIDR